MSRSTLLLAGVLAVLAAAYTPARAQLGSNDQRAVKEHVAEGERAVANGDYRAAAAAYARALALRPSAKDYAARAATYYYRAKNYRRAAQYYDSLINVDAYPKAPLMRARALKQQGLLAAAFVNYQRYLREYRGNDRDAVRFQVALEMQGAELARQQRNRIRFERTVEALPPDINTPANELAPMPLAPGVLYFLSDRRVEARMYRSYQQGDSWGPAELAGQFPVIPGKHIGSGAMGADGDRFYFSLCDSREDIARPTIPCTLHVIKREGDTWGKPAPLPPYINADGATTTHPFAYRDGDDEVLIFASNRPDSYGKLDLYVTRRDRASTTNDFEFPQNLGEGVNTAGNEISPHYDPDAATLHFASDGRVSMGGFDVYRAAGTPGGDWSLPRNLLAPVNSTADDYYYFPIAETGGAYLSSSRPSAYGSDSTSHEDLYLVKSAAEGALLTFQIVDSLAEENLDSVSLAAYVTPERGRPKLLIRGLAADGYVAVRVPLATTVAIELTRAGFAPQTFDVSVPATQQGALQIPRIRLAELNPGTGERKAAADDPADALAADGDLLMTLSELSTGVLQQLAEAELAEASAQVNERIAGGASAKDVTAAIARDLEGGDKSAGPAAGPEYRVQIEAVKSFKPDAKRYAGVADFGALTSDFIADRKIYRVLVGSFAAYDEAQATAKRLRTGGWANAFVTVFESGEYQGVARR